jgi:hypothetical protein
LRIVHRTRRASVRWQRAAGFLVDRCDTPGQLVLRRLTRSSRRLWWCRRRIGADVSSLRRHPFHPRSFVEHANIPGTHPTRSSLYLVHRNSRASPDVTTVTPPRVSGARAGRVEMTRWVTMTRNARIVLAVLESRDAYAPVDEATAERRTLGMGLATVTKRRAVGKALGRQMGGSRMAQVLQFNRYRRVAAEVTDGATTVRHDPHQVLLQSECRLLMAVLLDAVRAYKKYAFSGNRRGRRLFCEVEDWLLGDDDAPAVPFERLCQLLDLDAERIQRHLSSWRSANAVRTARSGSDTQPVEDHHAPRAL